MLTHWTLCCWFGLVTGVPTTELASSSAGRHSGTGSVRGDATCSSVREGAHKATRASNATLWRRCLRGDGKAEDRERCHGALRAHRLSPGLIRTGWGLINVALCSSMVRGIRERCVWLWYKKSQDEKYSFFSINIRKFSSGSILLLSEMPQVLSGDSLCLFDPCGEYLFTGEKQARNPPQASVPRGNFERASQAAGVVTGGGVGVSGASPIRGNSRARRTSLSASSSSPSTPRTPSPSLRNASSTPRPRSAFSSSSPSSSRRSAAQARRTVTVYGGASPTGMSQSNATGGADRVSGGGVSAGGGEGHDSTGGSPREPVGKRYIVRREDVFNQFPDQVTPRASLWKHSKTY